VNTQKREQQLRWQQLQQRRVTLRTKLPLPLLLLPPAAERQRVRHLPHQQRMMVVVLPSLLCLRGNRWSPPIAL